MQSLTDREMAQVAGVFEHLSVWMLGVFADPANAREIGELAANERLVREVRQDVVASDCGVDLVARGLSV